MYQYVQKNSGYETYFPSQGLLIQTRLIKSFPQFFCVFFLNRNSLFWKPITWCLGMYDSDLQIESYLHSNERCIWVVMPETSKQMRELEEQNVI